MGNGQLGRKLLESTKNFFRVLRKIVYYSCIKFGILKSWTNILTLRRFHLGFWQFQNKFIEKSNIGKKFFESFKVYNGFIEK